jgi:ADP-L-glycero-D-manno-heptose 6-epimerase
MIIAVTGAFGFIGSNLVKRLNLLGYKDIIAVDNLTNGNKIKNLNDCQILDFVDKDDFLQEIVKGNFDNEIDYIFHQGACSATTESDGKYMMKNNYEYSSILLEYTQKNEIPLTYASSAAVYGNKTKFIEDINYEYPLNVYAYSKFLFDQIVRRYFDTGLTAPVVGLRYFNVYGPNEFHKNNMASVILHNFRQYQQTQKVKLFQGCQGYSNGEQVRDFISVDDVVKLNLFFFNNHLKDKEEISGIYNCGTGKARSFNDLALATINACRAQEGKTALTLDEAVSSNVIEYIPFPDNLADKYQCFTQADLSYLRDLGYEDNFISLEDGVSSYVKWLLTK